MVVSVAPDSKPGVPRNFEVTSIESLFLLCLSSSFVFVVRLPYTRLAPLSHQKTASF